MYGTQYYGEYKDLNNNLIRVEILRQNYNINPTELMLSAPAITVSYEQEDYFKPIKKSGASISLLVPNVIQSLFTGEALTPQVRIYKNGDLFWMGYITPNLYTQEYKNEYDVLTLECVDTLSNLNNFHFSDSDSEITSFFDLITRMLDKVDTEKVINYIYVQKSVALNLESDILEHLYIQERNFFDEKGEPQKCDEVINDLLQYLGFQMFQYKDSYYIIDKEAIKQHHNFFIKYDRTDETHDYMQLNITASDVMDIGIGLGTGNVSLDGVYNKVTLIANNNPLSSILPDFDDEDDLVNQNEDQDKEWEEQYQTDENSYTLVSGYFKSKANWDYTIPSGLTELWQSPQIDEVTPSNRDTISSGIYWQRSAYFDNENAPVSTLDRKLYLTMVKQNSALILKTPELKLNAAKTMILQGGYLIINMKYKFSTDLRAQSAIKSQYDLFNVFGYCSDLMWVSGEDKIGSGNWPDNTNFPCRLWIDNYFFDGDEWKDYDWFNARVERGYYNFYGHTVSMGHITDGDTDWYRIKDQYGDWNYVTKAVYNASGAVKERGKSVPNNMYWWMENNTRVFFPIEYYNECILKDWFYLTHRNKITETIYDSEYQLTNTVSYKMNIVDSSDGVAIKCPSDKVLYGKLNFEIKACDKLGRNPQYRNDTGTTTVRAIHISDLTIKYSKQRSYQNIYSTQTVDPDVTYTNEISSGFCSELEDITLRVNTQNDIATSYSYVIGKNSNNKFYYIKDLTFNGVDKLAENRIVESYVNHYSQPKYIYSNTLTQKNSEITPFSIIYEHNLNKTMMVGNANYDLTNDRVELDTEEL